MSMLMVTSFWMCLLMRMLTLLMLILMLLACLLELTSWFILSGVPIEEAGSMSVEEATWGLLFFLGELSYSTSVFEEWL